MSKHKKIMRKKCHICGRRLSRNSLTSSRGDLTPIYNYVLKNGEIKPICVTCFHTLMSKEIARLIKKEEHDIAKLN